MSTDTQFAAGTEFYAYDQTADATDVVLDPPINMFYIGNYADADPDESDFNSENFGVFTGAGASNTTGLELVSVQPQDVENTGGSNENAILDNDGAGALGDRVTYTSPTTGNEVIATSDSTMVWNANVLLGDGTTQSIEVLVVQMTNGDTFVSDLVNAGTLDNLSIQSITLVNPTGTAFSGFFDNQDASGNRIVCFARGTTIATDRGAVPVQDLTAGDSVMTLNSGLQPVRWIGSKHISSQALHSNENLRPIRIRSGALGHGLPDSDLLVSPQHRILVSSKISQRMCGVDEILVAAKQLVMLDGIDIAHDVETVEYFHFLFDQHEVVFSNGAATESLFTGPVALASVSPAAKEEILTLFPELNDVNYEALPVRTLLNGRRARQLAHRHKENKMPLTNGAALH